MVGMEDAWVRVKRAQVNLERLQAEIAVYGRDHSDAHTVGMEHDGKGHVKLIARVRERPPKEWGLAAGDILVDLRCALDYAVYALAIANTGQDPPPSADRLEFPICETTDQWTQAIGRRKLDGLSPKAIDYIESEQPYKPGNGGPNAASVALDELVGVNKHRFIAVAWSKLHALKLPIRMEGMRIEDFVGYKIVGELKDGAVLATFRLVATQKESKVEIQPSLETFVAIEPTSKGWLDLTKTLRGLCATVEHYVNGMADCL